MEQRIFIEKAAERKHPEVHDGIVITPQCNHLIGFPQALRDIADKGDVCVFMVSCLTCGECYLCSVESKGTAVVDFEKSLVGVGMLYEGMSFQEHIHDGKFSYKRIPAKDAQILGYQ